MFNRTFQVKMIKTVKPQRTPEQLAEDEQETLDRVEQIAAVVKDIAWDAAKLVAAYMILDAFCKANVAKASMPCNCGGGCGCS